MGKVLNIKEEIDKMHQQVAADLSPEAEYVYTKFKSVFEHCFLAGLSLGAEDSVHALLDFATACAGLPEEKIYNHAAESLGYYWMQVLEKLDNEEEHKGENP